MKLRTAIALVALAVPAFAQRGGGHSGSFGARGSAGHAGFSSSGGFAPSGSFARSAPPARYGPGVGFRPSVPANYSGIRVPYARAISAPAYSAYRIPYTANRSVGFRPPYVPAGAVASLSRVRGPIGARRRPLENGWVSNNYYYPPYLGYPWVINPGFYDWSEPYDSAYDQASAAPAYLAPYPDEGYGAPSEPPAPVQAAASAPLAEPVLTVIFKSDRAPVKMQNYMVTAKVLTDLDNQRYEQIPLDQIDVAATQQANRAAGVEFQIPGAAGN